MCWFEKNQYHNLILFSLKSKALYPCDRQIQNYIASEKAAKNEADQQYMTVSIKADEDTRMKYITEVKEALRKAYALKISYSARKSGK